MYRKLFVLETKTRVNPSHFGGGSNYSAQFLNCGRSDLEDLVFDTCPDCRKTKMSSVPQGAYVAQKIHSNNMKTVPCGSMVSMIGRNEKTGPNPTYNQVNTQDLEHPLTKYNSKLMNSIWGMYNRYSVHNLKKITEGASVPQGGQQRYAAATPTSSCYGPTGGFKNGPLATPAWEVLWSNGHTY